MMDHFNRSSISLNRWKTTVDASMLYSGKLDRAPDNSGLTFWRNQLNNGMAYTEAIRLLRGGTEYRNRIGISTGC